MRFEFLLVDVAQFGRAPACGAGCRGFKSRRPPQPVKRAVSFDETDNNIDDMMSDVITKFYVYVLQSSRDRKLYIGLTTNLKRRFQQHARGEVRSTSKRRPFKLIHYEYFINKEDAGAREKYLKSGYGHEQLRNMLKRTMI